MSQLGKLYKYYFGKIFRRNGLRITLITLVVVVGWWFGLAYMVFGNDKRLALAKVEERIKESNDKSSNESPNIDLKFKEFCQILGGKKGARENFLDVQYRINEKALKNKLKELKAKKNTLSEKELGKLKKEVQLRTLFNEKGIVAESSVGFDSPGKPINTYFAKQTPEIPKLKLLNDISWWNLTGTIALFGLFFNILDNVFFKPQKEGEEAMILTLTPGVKRSDLFFSKILAFLTFYFIMNVLLFLLPFGFYYWGTGVNTSVGWFSLLALGTTIIGPILFFGLIFVPYLFLKAKVSWLGGVISTLLSFFPIAGFGIKVLAPTQTWLWSVENGFFNPVGFIPISLITGIGFLMLYHGHYQKQDLG